MSEASESTKRLELAVASALEEPREGHAAAFSRCAPSTPNTKRCCRWEEMLLRVPANTRGATFREMVETARSVPESIGDPLLPPRSSQSLSLVPPGNRRKSPFSRFGTDAPRYRTTAISITTPVAPDHYAENGSTAGIGRGGARGGASCGNPTILRCASANRRLCWS